MTMSDFRYLKRTSLSPPSARHGAYILAQVESEAHIGIPPTSLPSGLEACNRARILLRHSQGQARKFSNDGLVDEGPRRIPKGSTGGSGVAAKGR